MNKPKQKRNVFREMFEAMGVTILLAIEDNAPWYKNCHSVRKRGSKICEGCPFRFFIEQMEALNAEEKP